MDVTSTWNVSADSYLTSFAETNDESSLTFNNIIDNGHNIYYDGTLSANNWLKGGTYTLSGGGKLMPASAAAVEITSSSLPADFELGQNYPNPFNPSTNISYQLPKAGYVSLKVYNILGKEVAALVNEYKPAGKYTISYNASALASGIYIYKLSSSNYSSIKKMILMK